MANAPDTLLVTGPVFQQISADSILVTPPGGTQTTLAAAINGGTLDPGGSGLQNFSSITPAGSNQATAALVLGITQQLGTAASTTGVALPAAASVPLGDSLLMLNSGTAAVHVYGHSADTIDTIAGSTGVTLTNAFSCFFTPTTGTSWVSGPRGTISA
jgi:hypothetical protein